MNPEFWHQRWADNLIGFHQSSINPHLSSFWPRLEVAPGGSVLVPLCGKSLDMGWLAQRHPVLGVELSARAVEAFYRDSGLEPQRREHDSFVVYEAAGVTLYCGDFFALRPVHTTTVAAVYDRAALIALPPVMRLDYARQLARLTTPGTPLLLIVVEYDQAQMQGPPFAVGQDEVETLFGADWRIESLLRQEILDQEPRFRERGLSRLVEHVYLLHRY